MTLIKNTQAKLFLDYVRADYTQSTIGSRALIDPIAIGPYVFDLMYL